MEITARRTYKGAKATVVVSIDGVEHRLGGKRAERAAAAIVTKWASKEAPGVYGLRSDLAAAQAEARRLAGATTMRHAGHTFERTPAELALAVPVTDEPELCDHEGAERVTRTAHGYLGDAPAGTVQTLCADCGLVLEQYRYTGDPEAAVGDDPTPAERADAREAIRRCAPLAAELAARRDAAPDALPRRRRVRELLERLEADGYLRVVDA